MTQQRINVATFLAIALIGGGNPVGVAIAVDELDPLWAAAVRFLAAGVIFALAMVLFRVPVPRGRALAGGLIYGVIGFFGAFTFLFIGLQDTPPGTSQVRIGKRAGSWPRTAPPSPTGRTAPHARAARDT